MGRRAVPAALAFVALLADLSGHHAIALAALVIAIPAAFVLMLDCYGEALAARSGLVRPVLAAGGLVLIVLSAALRSPAVVGGVPRLAVSAVALAAVLAAAAVMRTPVTPARRRVQRPRREERRDGERLAA